MKRNLIRPGSRVRDLRTNQVGTLSGFTRQRRGIVRLDCGRLVFPRVGEIKGRYQEHPRTMRSTPRNRKRQALAAHLSVPVSCVRSCARNESGWRWKLAGKWGNVSVRVVAMAEIEARKGETR